MKSTLIALLLAGAAFVAPASAATFTVSDFAGTGTFGTINAVDNGGGNVSVTVQMAPNVIIDTGSHFALTLSLAGTGRIVESSFNTLGGVDVFDAAAHGGSYSNSPFGAFTDAVIGNCPGPGNSGNCGSLMSFNITGFQGFNPATGTFNGSQIFAAADIRLGGCSGDGCTGAVGTTLNPVASPVPGPLAGAGLPGLISAFGMIGLAWKRRRKFAA